MYTPYGMDEFSVDDRIKGETWKIARLHSTYDPKLKYFPPMLILKRGFSIYTPIKQVNMKPFLVCPCMSYVLCYFYRKHIFKEEGMEGKKKFRPNSDLKLMDQVREVLRYYHYAYRTEQTYCDWIKRYLKFHGMKRHPQEMGAMGNALECVG